MGSLARYTCRVVFDSNELSLQSSNPETQRCIVAVWKKTNSAIGAGSVVRPRFFLRRLGRCPPTNPAVRADIKVLVSRPTVLLTSPLRQACVGVALCTVWRAFYF